MIVSFARPYLKAVDLIHERLLPKAKHVTSPYACLSQLLIGIIGPTLMVFGQSTRMNQKNMPDLQ
jgi:hypothetical protein